MSNQPPYMPDPRYSQSGEQTEPVYNQGGYAPDNGYAQNNNYAQNNGYVQQSRQENNVDPAGRRVEQRQERYEDPVQRRTNLRYWIAAVIYFFLGVLEVILAMRFLFRLLGANETNSFVGGLYAFSGAFAGPFSGIFGSDPALGAGHVFEVSTLLAMIIYALVGWGIVALSRVILGPAASGGSSSATSTRRR
jgi:hypothetical protein